MSLAVITGPSRGVGRATALGLAQRGLSLALVGRRSPELDAAREAALAAGSPEVRAWHADLRESATLEPLGREIIAAQGAPLVLVNNAGVVHRKPLEAMTLALWDEQLAVNLTAAFALCRAFLPSMREARQGRIVHVGSISSTMGTPRLTAYCAAKWGLIGFMKSLAEEISDSGLMTVAVLPGSIDTRMLEGSGFPPRMSAEDVANTIVHYAMDAPLSHNGGVIEMLGV